jgi:hypothetical protein
MYSNRPATATADIQAAWTINSIPTRIEKLKVSVEAMGGSGWGKEGISW